MSNNLYLKRGNKNYKEKRLLKELNEFFEANPDQLENIQPAETFEELQSMYDSFVFDKYEDVSESNSEKVNEPEKKVNTNVDPLSRNEPIIRDYVLDNANQMGSNSKGQFFSEPVTFDDAFTIPNPDDTDEQEQEQPEKEKRERPVKEVFQNHSSSVDSKKRRRKTERFAKSIVNLTCDLWEKGFVWFVTKDITDEKLMEYEQELGCDLDLLLEMNDGQKATVRQFFMSQRIAAEQYAKIDQEDRDDLIDALVEVFLEKGIQPTATQDLILISLKVFGGSALKGFAVVQPVKMVLTQVKMAAEETQQFEAANPAPAAPVQNSQFNEQERDQELGGEITDEILEEEIENAE